MAKEVSVVLTVSVPDDWSDYETMAAVMDIYNEGQGDIVCPSFRYRMRKVQFVDIDFVRPAASNNAYPS